MKRVILFALSAMLLAVCGGCHRSEELAAVVNGDSITVSEFHKWLEVKPQVQVAVDPTKLVAGSGGQIMPQPYTGPVIGSLALQALNELVQQEIVFQMAKDEGVYPTDADIDAELDEKRKSDPSFVNRLQKAGYDIIMIRQAVMHDIAEYKLVTKGITVTDQEVDAFIAANPQQFTKPETADLTWMLVPDERTRSLADADLAKGEPFINVATRYSVAPGARTNGYRFPENRVPLLVNYSSELQAEVQKTAELATTTWLRFTEGFAKFYVNQKKPAEKVPIDQTVRKNVLRALALQRGQQGKDLNKRVQDRLKASKVEIMIDWLKEPWQQSMDKLRTESAAGR